MVYCGKPSSGCKTCRQRRVKCDEAKPICDRCKKSRRVCLGYRPTIDVLFRDQNESVEKRVLRDYQKPWQLPAAANAQPRDYLRASSSIPPDPLKQRVEHRPVLDMIQHSLFPPHEFVVLQRLLNDIASIPQDLKTEDGYLWFLPNLCADTSIDSALQAVTTAIAFATLGGHLRRPEYIIEARNQYSRAIQRTNTAIQDPVLAKKDETLMAVLLFSLFETLIGGQQSLLKWGTHAMGAFAIVKYRGRETFKTAISRRLYSAVKQNVIISHICRCEPFEENIDDSHIYESESQPGFKDRLLSLLYDIPMLRARSNKLLREDRSPENENAVYELIRACKNKDDALIEWAESVDSKWHPNTAFVIPQPKDMASVRWEEEAAYPGRIESYSDVRASSVWTMWRNSRIHISGTIIRAHLWLIDQVIDTTKHREKVTSHTDYMTARNVLQAMVDGTCASIPLQIRDIEVEYPSLGNIRIARMICEQAAAAVDGAVFPPNPGNHHEKSDSPNYDFLKRPLGGYQLMWPLFVASGVVTVSCYQERWIRGRLAYIGARFGVKQADVLGNLQAKDW